MLVIDRKCSSLSKVLKDCIASLLKSNAFLKTDVLSQIYETSLMYKGGKSKSYYLVKSDKKKHYQGFLL